MSWSEPCRGFWRNRRPANDGYNRGPRNQALQHQVAAGARRIPAHNESEEAEVDASRPVDDSRAAAVQPNPGENECLDWRDERPDGAQTDRPEQPGALAREEQIHRSAKQTRPPSRPTYGRQS